MKCSSTPAGLFAFLVLLPTAADSAASGDPAFGDRSETGLAKNIFRKARLSKTETKQTSAESLIRVYKHQTHSSVQAALRGEPGGLHMSRTFFFLKLRVLMCSEKPESKNKQEGQR